MTWTIKPEALDHGVDALAVIAILGVAYLGQYDMAIMGLVSIALGKKVIAK